MRKKYYFTKKYLKECQFSKLLFYFFSASYSPAAPKSTVRRQVCFLRKTHNHPEKIPIPAFLMAKTKFCHGEDKHLPWP